MKEHFLSAGKNYQTHVDYLKFALQFADVDIAGLVSSFNCEVRNNGWVGMRAYHDRALIDEFIRRSIDISCISDGKSINFNHYVRYEANRKKLVTTD